MGDETIRTFLFTDIERSTELWESAPEAMRTNLETHNQIIDRAIIENGGILFKRIGDATCSTFDSTFDAATAARTAQTAIANQVWIPRAPIRVRWAIHTGSVIQDGGDYLGPTVNYVARILNLAYPGQILLSEESASQLLPGDTTWLGMRQFKGVSVPAGICQLLHEDLELNFPALQGEMIGESNLPSSWNQFIGRASEIEQLRSTLQTKRLVTIIGPGGAGKTRSALEVASKVRGNYRHGIWLASLAPLDSSNLVLKEIARAVNHPKAIEVTDDSLIETLSEQNLLLIIDNCEHVLAEAARITSLILTRCPNVIVIATSRSPLQIPGEARFSLDSLTQPTDNSLEAMLVSEAVKLFQDRALEVLPTFSINGENAQAVFSLCKRVDGIPLALELAAAQLASYSPIEIDRLLAERAIRLRTEDPTVLPHRQTTDTTIDWSYQLLGTDEQWLCRKIAVFSGGATREAIKAVAQKEIATSLQKLVFSSLVKFDPTTQRYSMLELVKEFMIDRLIDAEELGEARDRHLDWIVDLAQEARPNLDGGNQAMWLDRLDLEHMNVRAAMTWSADRNQRLKAAVALHGFWFMRGHVREGQAWLAGSLSGFSPSDPALHAQAESALGVLYWVQGDYPNAKIHLELANELAIGSGDLKTGSAALANLAMVKAQSGDLDGAEADFIEALEGFRTIGDLTKQAHILNNVGVVLNMKGETGRAVEQVKASLCFYRQLGDLHNVGLGLSNIASYLRLLNQLPEAQGHALEAAKTLLSLKEYGGVGFCFVQIALIAHQKENWVESAQLQGKACATMHSAGYQVSLDSFESWKICLSATKLALGDKAYEAEFELGIQRPIESFLGSYP